MQNISGGTRVAQLPGNDVSHDLGVHSLQSHRLLQSVIDSQRLEKNSFLPQNTESYYQDLLNVDGSTAIGRSTSMSAIDNNVTEFATIFQSKHIEEFDSISKENDSSLSQNSSFSCSEIFVPDHRPV